MNTYKDKKVTKSFFFREFSQDVEEAQLVWHRDKKDRTVTVLSGIRWKIQFDNQLPKELKIGDIIFIPKDIFHRIWRGEDNLLLKIEER